MVHPIDGKLDHALREGACGVATLIRRAFHSLRQCSSGGLVVVDLYVVGIRMPFALFQKVLETQHEDCPFCRAVREDSGIAQPARMAEMDPTLFFVGA